MKLKNGNIKPMKKILILLLLALLPLVSAEETNFTDNARMTFGWAMIFHEATDNHPVAYIRAIQAGLLTDCYQGNCIFRTGGFGVTHFWFNDNYKYANFYIGSVNESRDFFFNASTGYLGLGRNPRAKLDVNGNTIITGNTQVKGSVSVGQLLYIEESEFPECNEKESGFRRNKTGIYGCIDDGQGWIRQR